MELNSVQSIRYHLVQFSKIAFSTVMILGVSLISWNYIIQHSRFINSSHLIIPIVQLSGVEELPIPNYFWPLEQNKSIEHNTLPIQLDTVITHQIQSPDHQ